MHARWIPRREVAKAAAPPVVPVPPARDMEIEERIARRHAADVAGKMNSYGGMGMDSISDEERALRIAEGKYIAAHPELYPRSPPKPRAEAYRRQEEWKFKK